MTMTAYSTAIVDGMLGWLKGLANWVLRLFNLAGSGGESPLLWLSKHWLSLLVVLMIVGVAGDILVWLIRWRPHWVWFRRERVIVDDERFFSGADIRDELEEDDRLRKNWSERDYVVSSTLVNAKRKGKRPPKRRPATRVDKRMVVRGGQRRNGLGVDDVPNADVTRRQSDGEPPRHRDMFEMKGKRPGVTDVYEDEVFNLSNLPKAEEATAEEQAEA